MMNNGKWLIVNDIPINRGKSSITKGKILSYVNGTFYLDGYVLPKDYQEDFMGLVQNDYRHTYLRPYNDVVGKPIIGGKGE